MGWAQFSWQLCFVFPGIVGLVLTKITIPDTDLKHTLLVWPIWILLSFILYKILLLREQWPELGDCTEECIEELLYWCVLPLILGTGLVSPLWGGIKLASWINPEHPFGFGFLWSIPLYILAALCLLVLADWRQRLIDRREEH